MISIICITKPVYWLFREQLYSSYIKYNMRQKLIEGSGY